MVDDVEQTERELNGDQAPKHWGGHGAISRNIAIWRMSSETRMEDLQGEAEFAVGKLGIRTKAPNPKRKGVFLPIQPSSPPTLKG